MKKIVLFNILVSISGFMLASNEYQEQSFDPKTNALHRVETKKVMLPDDTIKINQILLKSMFDYSKYRTVLKEIGNEGQQKSVNKSGTIVVGLGLVLSASPVTEEDVLKNYFMAKKMAKLALDRGYSLSAFHSSNYRFLLNDYFAKYKIKPRFISSKVLREINEIERELRSF